MSQRKKWILGVMATLIVVWTIFGILEYQKIRRIYRIALLSTSEHHAKLHGDFAYITDLTMRSDIVVRGVITNPKTTVSASPDQSEVSYPQGWVVSLVNVTDTLSGVVDTHEILIGSGWWPTHLVGNSFIEPFLEGQEFLFFLKKNDDMWRWCKTTVYSHSGTDLIPLNKTGSNKGLDSIRLPLQNKSQNDD